jgi:hypothetical protein
MRVIGLNTRRAVAAVVTVAVRAEVVTTAVRAEVVRAEVADVAEARAPTTARTYRALHSSDLGIGHLGHDIYLGLGHLGLLDMVRDVRKSPDICGRLRRYPTALHSNCSDHWRVHDILEKLGRGGSKR